MPRRRVEPYASGRDRLLRTRPVHVGAWQLRRAGRRGRDRVIVTVATPLGALLVILGQVGARTGWISIPFDPHHIIAQVAGFALLVFGLTRWR